MISLTTATVDQSNAHSLSVKVDTAESCPSEHHILLMSLPGKEPSTIYARSRTTVPCSPVYCICGSIHLSPISETCPGLTCESWHSSSKPLHGSIAPLSIAQGCKPVLGLGRRVSGYDGSTGSQGSRHDRDQKIVQRVTRDRHTQ